MNEPVQADDKPELGLLTEPTTMPTDSASRPYRVVRELPAEVASKDRRGRGY